VRVHGLESDEQDFLPLQFLLDEGVSVPEGVGADFCSFLGCFGIHTCLGAVAFGTSFLGCHAAFSSFCGMWMSSSRFFFLFFFGAIFFFCSDFFLDFYVTLERLSMICG
jgi:hypothetical protein